MISKKLKKLIRNNQACATKTKFTTSLTAAKKVRVSEVPYEAVPRVSSLKVKEKKYQIAWSPPTWGEQADGYKATTRAFSGFSKEESKKKGSFLTKHSFSGTMFEKEMDKKYCSPFNTVGCFCEPGSGCVKKHIPFFRMKPFERAAQFEHVKRNRHNIAINGDQVRDVPENMKTLIKFPGSGEI